jgi:hypothetical protein
MGREEISPIVAAAPVEAPAPSSGGSQMSPIAADEIERRQTGKNDKVVHFHIFFTNRTTESDEGT